MFHFFINISSFYSFIDFKMLLKHFIRCLLPAAGLVNAQFSIGTYTSLVSGLDKNSSLLGDYCD